MSNLVLENQYELPSGWSHSTIENMISFDGLFVDGDWIESKDQDPNGDVRLTQLADIGINNFKNKSNRFMTIEKAKKLNCTFIQKNDILVARMPNPLGRACIFPDYVQKCVTVVDVAIIRTGFNGCVPKWLMHMINCPQIQNKIYNLQSGTTRKRISRKNLSKIIFSIPPIKEQKRIVEKIEESFLIVNFNIKNIKNSLKQITHYKQTLLESAFNGNLTKQWRSKNLEQIKLEQTNLVKKLEGKQKELGTNFVPFNDIPSWKIVPFEFLFNNAKNGFSKRYTNNGIMTVVIRLADIKNGVISEKSFRKIKMTLQEQEKYLLEKNNLLCIRVNGSDNLVGRMIVCNTDKKWAYSDHLIAYKINNFVLPHFVSEFFNTQYVRNYIKLNKVSTAGQNTINQSKLSKILIPLPTVSEQAFILKEIDIYNTLLNSCTAQLEICLKQHYSLQYSILKQAFEGKLVPQDLNDKSIEILLQKIKQEKEQLIQKQKASRRKKNVK